MGTIRHFLPSSLHEGRGWLWPQHVSQFTAGFEVGHDRSAYGETLDLVSRIPMLTLGMEHVVWRGNLTTVHRYLRSLRLQ